MEAGAEEGGALSPHIAPPSHQWWVLDVVVLRHV
jgi:hypothetical protein